MKIMIFAGFLGSGKTSTILQVIKEIVARNETAAIIENEIGEKGIDDKLLEEGSLTVKPLFGGCVCCQITGDLLAAIKEIAQEVNPGWLIIEMTGLASPINVADSIRESDYGRTFCKTITVIDAERWGVLIRAVEPLIISQIKGSDVIIVNKTDITGLDISRIIAEVKSINIHAPVLCSSAKIKLPSGFFEEVTRLEK